MKKKIMCCCFVLFSLYMWFCTPVQASTKGVSLDCNDNTNATFYAPLTSSGKTNKIHVQYDNNIGALRVYVDGEKALVIKGYVDVGIDVRYIQLSKSRRFLQIYLSGYDYDIYSNNLYRYSVSTHTLKKVGTLQVDKKLEQTDEGAYAVRVDSDRVKVSWYLDTQEVSLIKITLIYKYKNGRFSVNPTSVKVKSLCSGQGTNFFLAAKNLTFYKDTDLKKSAFRVSKGDMVKLVSVRLKGGKIYYKFKKGNKTGWQKSKDWSAMHSVWFDGVEYVG